jgi:hypothetical protein
MARSKTFAIDALDRDGCGIRVSFDAAGESFRQTIAAVSGERVWPLLHSDSIPWQEIVEHQQPQEQPSLLLTGSGDGSYWSATLTAITDVHFALVGFDVACRRRRLVKLPTVRYRLAADVDGTSLDGSVIVRTPEGGGFTLHTGTMPNSIATEFAATCVVALTGRSITIEALAAPHVSTRETVQLRYEILALRR